MRDAILATGEITPDDVAADLARPDDPSITWPSSVLWAVRARKPVVRSGSS